MGKWIIENIKYIKKSIVDIIYDEDEDVCLNCGKLISSTFLCMQCRNLIIIPKEKYNITRDNITIEIYSSAYYSSVIKNLIISLKYKNNFLCGEFLNILMTECIDNWSIKNIDIITYVPMSIKDINKRGFNQSKYLAILLGNSLNIKVKDLLNKTVQGTKQKTLNEEERWENAKNSYEFSKKFNIKDKNILLVDDVMTTGATVFYCSLKLINEGAKRVTVLTVAKSRI